MSGQPASLTTQRLRTVQGVAVIAFAIVLPFRQALSEIALVIGLVAWVGRLLITRQTSEMTRNPLNLFLLAWLAAAILSMQNSIDMAASLRGLHKLVKYFALYLLVSSTANTEKSLKGVVKGCLVGLGLIVVDSLWQAVFNHDLFYGNPIGDALSGAVKRVQATFHHPSELGIYLASFTPLALAAAYLGSRRWRRPLALLVALTVVVEVLNRSRGGMLAFLIELMALSLLLRHWIPVGIAGLTALLQAWTIPAAVKAWAAAAPSLFYQFAQPDRPMIWQAAINMIKAHPIVGVGTNTFVKVYARYCLPTDPFGRDPLGPYAHNQYLHLTAELGVVGLTVFILLLVVVGRMVARGLVLRSRAPAQAMVSIGCGAGLIGYLIAGLFESSLFHSRGSVMFWFLVGLIMAAGAVKSRTTPTSS